ncbi:hypothetical protein ACGF0D_23795 [Kitasatospora sp. NPDC048298]|uniref:hypothetical protein n=1 Tax=Kitasatospora sp. NPDC048298 TaxID=3364049 RepID=UPI003710DE36
MTTDPTASVNSPAPEADWDRRLAEAFAVLLGRPLEEYDPKAVYAARVSGNLMDESGFERDAAWVHPAALRGEHPVAADLYLFDEAERTPGFDASRSLFEFRPSDAPRADLPEGFAAAVEAACFTRALVRGADLGALAERYGVDLASPALAGAWSVHFARLVCDGTLLDALRAALGTGRTPEELTPFSAEPEEDWEEALAAIPHPGLRAHLGFFCTDGDEGLMPLAQDATAYGLEDEGCEAVAGWEDGHGQLDITVVRLSDLVAGPRR